MLGIHGYEDHVLAYQSKVTPVKWLEPTTPSEIENAINEDRALVIVPIAFVSDHSETLVELDICLLYTSPSPRDLSTSRMPSSA